MRMELPFSETRKTKSRTGLGVRAKLLILPDKRLGGRKHFSKNMVHRFYYVNS